VSVRFIDLAATIAFPLSSYQAMSDHPMPSAFVAPEPADLAPLFPGYEIEGLIATGGMGAVYGAVQKSLERAVAIKILPQEFTQDQAFHSRFEAEAKAMARLNHPNLIGVYDFGEVAGMLYIIMEYVPGQSLHHSAHGIAIDPTEVIRLVTGICHGLAHAHENGIIHRDIKPSNILLDLNANPKIGDFGLARPADRQIQAGEEIFGTPNYTAPEVLSSPSSVDQRADIFSVGVMLHELLTGRLPAEDHRTASAISMCDPRFDAVIRRATDPLPDRRYASALDIINELHLIATTVGPKVLRTVPAVAKPHVRRGKVKSPRRTRKSSTGPIVVIILFLAGIAVLGLKHYALQKSAEKEPAPPPEAPLQPAPIVEAPVEEPVTPEPKPEPPPVPDPVPEERAPEAPQPIFNVADFLESARKAMRDRAAPLIDEHHGNLKKNTDACIRALIYGIAQIDRQETREEAVTAMEEFLKSQRNSANRLPAELNYELSSLEDFKQIHAGFHDKQKELESAFGAQLSSLSATYVLGIEKQIERLATENDPVAVKLLEQEIELVRQKEEHFPNLMLGQPAEPAEVDQEAEPDQEAER
jgi:serine/threonine protein kinase